MVWGTGCLADRRRITCGFIGSRLQRHRKEHVAAGIDTRGIQRNESKSYDTSHLGVLERSRDSKFLAIIFKQDWNQRKLHSIVSTERHVVPVLGLAPGQLNSSRSGEFSYFLSLENRTRSAIYLGHSSPEATFRGKGTAANGVGRQG